MPSKKLLVPPALQNKTKTQPLYLFHIISPSSNPYLKFQVLALMNTSLGNAQHQTFTFILFVLFIHQNLIKSVTVSLLSSHTSKTN